MPIRSCNQNPTIVAITLSLACVCLLGCRNAETISPDEFVRRYDDVRFRHGYNDYVGRRGKYHVMDQYGLGVDSVVRRRSRFRCAVANLPRDFPNKPQRDFEPDRCIGDISADAGPCPFAYPVTAIKHPTMLDYVAADLARNSVLQFNPIFGLFTPVGARPLGESWWIRYEQIRLTKDSGDPLSLDFLVKAGWKRNR